MIGHSVQLALETLAVARRHEGEGRKVYGEAAMLHACNAVDGTASKRFGGVVPGNAKRFTQMIRDELDIFEHIGMPGIDLRATRFPYKNVKAQSSDGRPDIADVLYYMHRCAHGHGDEVERGFELQPCDGEAGNHSMRFIPDAVSLPESAILGLLAIAVLAPENSGQRAWDASIPWARGTLVVNVWWGRREDFLELAERGGYNRHKLDFTPADDPNGPLNEIVNGILKRTSADASD
ncbi:Uncharacterised protein [Mycobacteroides abscessus subsp. abscessus]|nr:Uncharacterised protein [Mycobacteroides abscessus subsp. abscessus]SLE51699.1 Uncharacterised protein [Mycobacteroides abscessus subsp. abscessus]